MRFPCIPGIPEGSQYRFLLKPSKVGFYSLQLKIPPYTTNRACFSNEMKKGLHSQHFLFLFDSPSYTLICPLKRQLKMSCINELPSLLVSSWVQPIQSLSMRCDGERRVGWKYSHIPLVLSLKAYCSLTVSLYWVGTPDSQSSDFYFPHRSESHESILILLLLSLR